MHKPMPSLSALRAFEAAARHLSLTKAAEELHVTAGALSHQIRGLEETLGIKLFERRVRSIALTPTGKLLYPGLQTGFTHIRDAVAELKTADESVLVISAPPGFTSKWLAPRLHRFSSAFPQIDARFSSSTNKANFMTDGVNVAIRNSPIGSLVDPTLLVEKLFDLSFVPVCSPKLIEKEGPFERAEDLMGLPLIHDDMFASIGNAPSWTHWFKAAGVDCVDSSRGLHFDSADHALDAAGEGAGVLLAPDLLAYDDLRTGRLVIPFELAWPSGWAYHFVCLRRRSEHAHVRAFRNWAKQEMAVMKKAIRALNQESI